MYYQRDVEIREIYRQEWLAQAEHQRLVRQASQAETPGYRLLLARLGQTLSGWGYHLQVKYGDLAPERVRPQAASCAGELA